MLITIGVKHKGEWRHHFQDSLWHIKVRIQPLLLPNIQALLLIGGLIGIFAAPNELFVVYGWIALIGSGLFVLIQLIYLVDFVHTIAEYLIGKWQEGEQTSWYSLLLFLTGFCYVAVLVVSIILYIYFPCQFSYIFVTLNVILGIAVGITSVHPQVQEKNPKSGLLQSSFILAYGTYLVSASLMRYRFKYC